MRHSREEAALIGLAVGLVVAAGGAYKDAPYEGFKPATFWRSPMVAAVEAPILAELFDYPNPLLLALATMAAERVTVEGWKIARCKMPGKFEVGEWGIPKQLTTDGTARLAEVTHAT